MVTLTHAGQTFGTYSTPWRDDADAVAADAAEVLVWGDTTVRARTRLDSLTLGERGERVGTVRFTIEHHDPVTVPLELERSIEDPGSGGAGRTRSAGSRRPRRPGRRPLPADHRGAAPTGAASAGRWGLAA